MNKAYFIAPLIALIAFSGLYFKTTGSIKAKQEAALVAEKARIAAKNEADAIAKKKAFEDAVAASDARKAERLKKEALRNAEKDARQAAIDARDSASLEQEKLSKDIKRLREEIQDERKQIAEIETTKKALLAEQAFLKEYVAKAEANTASLETVLQRIAAADLAAAEAAKAAAAAKK